MRRDVELFLKAYPSVTMIEALITDCNGVARGKWIPRSKLETVLKDGLKLPKSALGLDIWGRDIPELAFDTGDVDGYCWVVEDSLLPVLTERGVDQAQLIMSMYNGDDSPFMGDPRQVLKKLVDAFTEKEMRPCMAVELEFSLFADPGREKSLREAVAAAANMGGNMYALNELDYQTEMLEVLRQSFEVQGLPFEGIVKEAAPAQYEINMAHSDDVMTLADTIVRMQRSIRAVAARCGLIASFMPKPMDDEAGNGMHVHCSLLEASGVNVFNDGGDEGTDLLKQGIGGCLELMRDSMLIFAPSFNGYRRFQAGNHAPTLPTWGWDNRTTALRIPAGPPAAKRIEHRVAGADANPYLVIAVVLAGLLRGLEKSVKPPAAIEGNAWEAAADVEPLPSVMGEAIRRFSASETLGTYMSETFQNLYTKTKLQELNEFERRVTDFEVESYLRG